MPLENVLNYCDDNPAEDFDYSADNFEFTGGDFPELRAIIAFYFNLQ